MARAIHWRIPFVSLDDTPYQVNIYEEGYQGNVVILKGGAQPFVTEELDDPDAFLPIRTSSGYITVICESASLVNDILPVNVHDRYVELVDVTPNANKVAWNGYVMPEEYSGDWNVTPFELSLPVASPIGACLDLKYDGFFKAVTIGDCLKKILNNQLKVNPTYIMSGKFPAQTASMLTAIFSDIMFAEVENDSLSPAYGSGQNVRIEEEYSTIGDILEALCKLYGYVIHETPDALWFCSSDMGLDYYQTEINYTQNASYLQSESVVTLTDADLPMVTSALNSRSLLPGKSKVRVYCEAEEVGEMLEIDYDGQTPSSPRCYDWIDGSDTYGFNRILWANNSDNICYQYDMQDIAHTGVDMFDENFYAAGRVYYGACFISIAKWEYPRYIPQTDFSKYNPYLLLSSSYGDHLTAPLKLCARLKSKKQYSAINFTENGLRFNLKCLGSKDWINFKLPEWAYRHHLVMVIRWGDYVYSPRYDSEGFPINDHTAWGEWPEDHPQQPKIEYTLSSEENYIPHTTESIPNDEKTSTGFFSMVRSYIYDWWTITEVEEGIQIVVPSDIAALIYGYITVDFYSFYEQDGIKYLLLSDISLWHKEFPVKSLDDDTDYYLSDFRRQLSNSKNEEYEYEQTLNNLMVRYSPSGVLPPTLEQGSSADYYEQTILDRLASWYDRTIEQITVTVQNENISPGQRIARGNDKYIVVSKAHNWRDGMVTLTMQKLYEQAQT